jgi:SAM-dependent methyltransferase
MKIPSYSKNKWLWILLVIAIILVIMIVYKKIGIKKNEGFDQGSPFVLKRNNDIYDSYYAMIYDDLHKSKPRVEFEYQKIVDMTHPSIEKSIFLDIGSGTGNLVNQLSTEGYTAYGIDESKSMLEVSQYKYPKNNVKLGTIIDPMAYDRGSFTHITCMNFTIYHFQDKRIFFRNCYHWLGANGYLILHLVDRTKYNPIIPAAIPSSIENPQEYSDTRITEAAVQFPGFSYKTSTNFIPDKKDCRVIISETFKDNNTNKVRQNELTLYMEDIKDILYIASKCGFIIQGKSEFIKDKWQYIYVLERQE